MPQLIEPKIDLVKNRVIEASEIDAKGLLRPLLLFRGSVTEGRARSLWNLIVSMMDAGVPSVTEGVKVARLEDYRHLCGLHANPQNSVFNSILARIVAKRHTAELVTGLWEYARHLSHSTGATPYILEPIGEYAIKTKRQWRIMPGSMRQRFARAAQPTLSEVYPFISGPVLDDHKLLIAVDAVVPKGLPNDVRCDVCQDLIVAILTGESSIDELRGETGKYLKKFWQMFPTKYGHVSLDGVVPGTTDMRWDDKLDARHSRAV